MSAFFLRFFFLRFFKISINSSVFGGVAYSLTPYVFGLINAGHNNKIMAEFNPPRKWVLGRELSYTTEGLTTEDVEALRSVGVSMAKDQIGTEICDRVTVPQNTETELSFKNCVAK